LFLLNSRTQFAHSCNVISLLLLALSVAECFRDEECIHSSRRTSWRQGATCKNWT